MKISIITVCYNSAKTISDTINSVANQTLTNKEHIIVDGGSTDLTMDIVAAAAEYVRFISEPDKGIYDAMNKGIELATGDVIGTLNADDFYYDSQVLKEVERVFLDPNVDACYGDLIYVKQDDTGQTVRFWKSNEYKDKLFKSGWMPAHPTFFVRKSVYEKFGRFDLNFKIAADFELLFRLIEQHKIRTVYIPKVLVKMRLGGTTNKNISNILTQNKEIISTLRRHYPNFSLLKFISKKIGNRLKQFFARPTQ